VRRALSPLSIERKVPLALGVIILLVTTALSLTAYVAVRQGAEREYLDGLQGSAHQVAELVEASLRQSLRTVREAAADPALAGFLGPQGEDQRGAALARLQERARVSTVVAVELLDAGGERRLTAGNGSAALAGIAPRLLAGRGAAEPGETVGALQRYGGSAVVALIMPVRGPRGIVGHLVEWRSVVLNIRLGRARFLVGNREGGLWTDGKGFLPAPPVDVSQRRMLSYERPGAGRQLAIIVPISGTPWLGLVELPAAAVTEGPRRFLGLMAALGGILFLASLVLASLWGRRVTRPLVELTRAAEAIAEGDLSARVGVGRRDELGRLEAAFNRMTERLEESKEQLERKVVELRQTQEQFTRAQRMEVVGLLSGGIAHDFNNLLTIIIGETEVTLATLAPDNPARQPLQAISAAGDRAAALTRQLLVFSRGQVIEPAVFDLDAVVSGTVRMMHRLIREDVEVFARRSPRPRLVNADRGQVEQVIMNLMVNARDAMPTGGRLYLETQEVTFDDATAAAYGKLPPGDYVALVVSDTGVGMSDEVKSHLFEPFYTTKQPGKGTGLGLSACRGIVSRWGGHVSIYSEEGVGTTVKAYFPMVAESALVEEPQLAPASGGAETILLVDDEEAVRELAARILRTRGYSVIPAADATAALAALERTGKVDLLITDVVLPGLSGRELAERAAQLRPGLRVLFMSGYTEDVILQRQLLAHDVAILQKPFTADRLARRAREALDATGEPPPATSPG
jgi:signal transduction histidine kinase/ActR/RegA family two-component response regulator